MDIVDLTVPVSCTPPSGSLFPVGTTTVQCVATDAHHNSSTASFTVTVTPALPPPVVVRLTPGVLWPPNHKMVHIAVAVQTAPGATCSILSVASNEPIDGTGDGDTAPDWIFGGMKLQLRSERAGTGTGRVYTVTVQCRGTDGAVGTGTATAVCPHDMSGQRR
jgi:hypothetical protein